eukprot:s5020_g6.t1
MSSTSWRSDSESPMNTDMPAPTFPPQGVLVVNVEASITETSVQIKARSMGGNVVCVLDHSKAKSLAMNELKRQLRQLAIKNGFLTVLSDIRVLGKGSRSLEGNTCVWLADRWKIHCERDLIARKTILRTKVDPRVITLARYIEADD